MTCPGRRFVAFRGAKDATVREVNGGAEAVAVVGQIPIETVRPRKIRVGGGTSDEAGDRFDGESRCDLASLVTTHAIRDGKKTNAGIGHERIFIRFSNRPGICRRTRAKQSHTPFHSVGTHDGIGTSSESGNLDYMNERTSEQYY